MPGISAINRRTFLTAGATLAAARLSASPQNQPAPRFHLRTTEGESFNNDSLKGHTVLIQFWATWCQYCRSDQSAVDDIAAKYAGKGLEVFAVNFGESKKKVKKYLEASPRSCNIVLMEDTNLAAMFPTRSFPLYIVIDKDGNFAGRQNGAAGEGALVSLLKRAGLGAE